MGGIAKGRGDRSRGKCISDAYQGRHREDNSLGDPRRRTLGAPVVDTPSTTANLLHSPPCYRVLRVRARKIRAKISSFSRADDHRAVHHGHVIVTHRGIARALHFENVIHHLASLFITYLRYMAPSSYLSDRGIYVPFNAPRQFFSATLLKNCSYFVSFVSASDKYYVSMYILHSFKLKVIFFFFRSIVYTSIRTLSVFLCEKYRKINERRRH